jgi:hypothetical protein
MASHSSVIELSEVGGSAAIGGPGATGGWDRVQAPITIAIKALGSVARMS